MSGPGRRLTPKQERFCSEYLIDFNATQAAIRAGYSPRTAKQQGSRLLTNADIADHQATLVRARTARTEITADRVLRDLRTVADRCLAEEPVLDANGAPTGRWKFDPHPAIRALELLGKHLGLFSVAVPVYPAEVRIADLTPDALEAEIARLDRAIAELESPSGFPHDPRGA